MTDLSSANICISFQGVHLIGVFSENQLFVMMYVEQENYT